MNNILKNKKFKYGSVALAFTAIFVAIIILLNAILTALDSKYGLYAEISGEQRYEISDRSHELLDGTDNEIRIVFCSPRDILQNSGLMSMIVTLAEKFEAEFPDISVSFVDIGRNISEARALAGASTETKLESTDVIIRSDKTGKVRIVKGPSFFTLSSDGQSYYGFNGEMRFVESILAVVNASDDKVAIITGHGEDENLAALGEVLFGAGYDQTEQVKVDLSTGEIPENTRLVIINNPKRDFLGHSSAGAGNADEISKLNKYLQSYGNLFVLIDNETPALPELSELLSEWGIAYASGLVVEDAENSVSTDGRGIIAVYNHLTENSAGEQIAKKSDVSSSRTIMNSSTPLVLDADKGASAILASSPSAIVFNGKEPVAQGTWPLMAISSRFEYDENQNERYSHVIVSGSADFVHADMASAATGNADLMRNILGVVSTEKVASNIPVKPFQDTSIAGIGTATARDMTVKVTVIPAVLVLIIGIVVFVKRKRL